MLPRASYPPSHGVTLRMLVLPTAQLPDRDAHSVLVQVKASRDWQMTAAETAVQQDALMEKRRADRTAHQHKQIWTKDPHGGPYRKVREYGVAIALCSHAETPGIDGSCCSGIALAV